MFPLRIEVLVRLLMVSPEQIQRFFARQCTAEEAEQVAAWLQAHPGEAAAYFEEADWHNASAGEPMPNDVYTGSWQQIQGKIKRSKRLVLLQRTAVAACIALCFAMGIFFLTKTKTPSVTAAVVSNVSPTIKVLIADTEYNVSGKPKRIPMADGSVITLSPKSVVWFDTPFAKTNTRDIHLQGEARFEVAKNKKKPFTVYSGSFSTTALGTEFIVKEQASSIRIQLFHGKVVIKNTDHSVKNWENIFLLPQQQMIYNNNDALARVSRIQELTTATALPAKKQTQRETADSLIFNGSPMATVLHKLRDYYHVDIRFANEDIRHISFTGVVVKKDSVQTILKAIAQMNDLLIENTDSSFIISKEKN